MMDVQRVDDISHEEFMTKFYEPGIPVVFRNASNVWKAKGVFSPDWFRKNYGNRTKRMHGATYTMNQIMDMVEASTEAKPAPYPIVFNVPNELPELLPLITPLNLNYASPNWLERRVFQVGKWGGNTEIFIGGAGGQFPYAHIDLFHLSAWISQLYGEKRFTVFPRDQTEFLYPKPDEPWKSTVNIFNPDYEKHPKYRQATPISFTCGPGETLFIPFGLWHTAYSLTPTISVAFDQLNGKNYKDFMKDVWVLKKRGGGVMKAAAMYSYALVAGQGCKIVDGMRPKYLERPGA
jgi:histone arginine demethylase JMJD6